MGFLNTAIRKSDLGGNQQELVSLALQKFISSMIQALPQLHTHFLSGGTIQILTMSGVDLKVGFEPQIGGLIVPNSVNPSKGSVLTP